MVPPLHLSWILVPLDTLMTCFSMAIYCCDDPVFIEHFTIVLPYHGKKRAKKNRIGAVGSKAEIDTRFK